MPELKRPKLLVGLLGLISLLCISAVAFATEGEDPKREAIVHLPQGEPLATPTDEEFRSAEEILRNSGRVETVAGQAEWKAATAAYAYVGNGSQVVTFRVVLANPVPATGSWDILSCQNTRLIQVSSAFTNVQTIRAMVDLETREVVQFGVTAPYQLDGPPIAGPVLADPDSDREYLITDLLSGTTMEVVGKQVPGCPAGREDD